MSVLPMLRASAASAVAEAVRDELLSGAYPPGAGLSELGGARGERADLAGAVEQRVLGVDVEVRAAGSAHGR